MKKIKLSLIQFLSIILIVFVMVSLVVYFFVLNVQNNRLFIKDAFDNNNNIATSATNNLNNTLNEQYSTIISVEVAHHNIIDEGSIFEHDYYETILSQNEYITSLEVLDLSGEIIYSSRQSDNRIGLSMAEYYLVKEIDDIHQLHIGGLIYDTENHELALEVLYSGESVVVLSKISIGFFHEYGEEFKVSFPNKEVMIFDELGVFLFDSKNNKHLIQYRDPIYDELLDDYNETEVYTRVIYGEESVVSIQPFSSENWTLIIYENVDSALSLNKLSTQFYTYSIITIIAVFILLYSMVNIKITREFNMLTKVFKKFGKGEFSDKLEPSSFKEIDSIRDSINILGNDLSSMRDRLTYLAYHDALTGLYTKNKAKDDFERLIANLKNGLAFMYFDIDRFRVINENFGYDVGDNCLIQIAIILKRQFKNVYRVEGDEFLAIVEYNDVQEIQNKMISINKTLKKGVSIEGTIHGLSCKSGISIYDEHGSDFESLFKKSIIALEDVRVSAHSNLLMYDDTKDEYYSRRSRIELLLNSAFDKNEFRTVYQPIVNIKDNQIRGFESLSRWTSEELGIVSPGEFVPILEQTKKISRLDEYVLNNALVTNKFLCDEYGTKYVASINISVETLMKENFTNMIDDALEKFNYDPSLLELEITESSIIRDFDAVTKKMEYLKSKGVKFSEDDFGDGFSSLTYLTRLNIDTLKISRNFLLSILNNVKNRVLVQTIITLSKRLGFYTIVEGVEDQETYELFKDYGCDYVQGYLFYRPMEEQKLLELVKKQKSKKE